MRAYNARKRRPVTSDTSLIPGLWPEDDAPRQPPPKAKRKHGQRVSPEPEAQPTLLDLMATGTWNGASASIEREGPADPARGTRCRETEGGPTRLTPALHPAHRAQRRPARGPRAKSPPSSLRARIAALHLHATHDSRQLTEPARSAFLNRFETAVDPQGILSPEERQRRAALARREHFTRLAYASARSRSRGRLTLRARDGDG